MNITDYDYKQFYDVIYKESKKIGMRKDYVPLRYFIFIVLFWVFCSIQFYLFIINMDFLMMHKTKENNIAIFCVSMMLSITFMIWVSWFDKKLHFTNKLKADIIQDLLINIFMLILVLELQKKGSIELNYFLEFILGNVLLILLVSKLKFNQDKTYSKLTSKNNRLFSLKLLEYSGKVIEIYFIKNNILNFNKLQAELNDLKLKKVNTEKNNEWEFLMEYTSLILSYKEFIDKSIEELDRLLQEYTEERNKLFKYFKYLITGVSGYLLTLFSDGNLNIFVILLFIYIIVSLGILYVMDLLSKAIRFFLVKNSIKYPKVKQELIYIQKELEDILIYQENQLINQKIKSYL